MKNNTLRLLIRESIKSIVEAAPIYTSRQGTKPPVKKQPEAKVQVGAGKTALAVGDSQMGYMIGRGLQSHLKSVGYTVTFVSAAGQPASGVLKKFNENYTPGAYDLVILTIGGNNSTAESTESAIRSMHEKVVGQDDGHMIVVGPPPATLITDTAVAVKSWGQQASNPRYMLDRDKGAFAVRRETVSKKVDDLVLDNTLTYGVATQQSGKYPDQPDGLHCSVGAEPIVQDIITKAQAKGIPV